MEQIHNSTPIEKDSQPKLNTSKFDVKNNVNLILCVINSPIGEVKIDAGMTLTSADKTTTIPLNFIMLDGDPKKMLEDLLMGAGSILASGMKKNEKDAKKIIVPEKKIITRD